jgi:hypothetical protein
LESCGASHGIPQFHGDSSGIRIKKILLGSKNILLGLNKLLSGSKKTILGEGRKEGRKLKAVFQDTGHFLKVALQLYHIIST